MGMHKHVILMASYNRWMNERLYDAACVLPAAALEADRGAFFGSILGTLNHIAVGDTIWLKRFATHPAGHASLTAVRALPTPARLDQILFDEVGALRSHRRMLDDVIERWAVELGEADLQHVLRYTNSRGESFARSFESLVMHFFNHQTHHRGQITTLLSQSGVDVGATDLLVIIPDADQGTAGN